MAEAATVGGGGCNRRWRRLQHGGGTEARRKALRLIFLRAFVEVEAGIRLAALRKAERAPELGVEKVNHQLSLDVARDVRRMQTRVPVAEEAGRHNPGGASTDTHEHGL